MQFCTFPARCVSARLSALCSFHFNLELSVTQSPLPPFSPSQISHHLFLSLSLSPPSALPHPPTIVEMKRKVAKE